MATIVPPPEASRAREILRDMREKRETLLSNNPTLQGGGASAASASASAATTKGQKPPTVPRKRPNDKLLIPSSPAGSSRAREILGDLQKKRASLSAVLEACKQSPGSPSSKRSNLSVGGPSTAPTAASTRSWLSSNADDDSFCYSETSFEDSPKESSIEFIIDTEDSDFSLTTKEEVEEAIGAIYHEVIPQAIHQAKKQQAKDTSIKTATEKTTTTTSWTFQTQTSARNLYREESFRVSKSEKKKRRIKVSDKKKRMQSEKKDSSRSVSSWASTTNGDAIDLNQVRKQRSRIQEMMSSISELKEVEDLASPVRKSKSSRSIRRLRQDDCSEGSAPISSKSSRRSKKAAEDSTTAKLDFDLSAMKEPSRRKKNASSSLASHYVIETKVKRGQKKKVVVKPSERYVAPSPDPDNMKSESSVSEDSLLASPKGPLHLVNIENNDEDEQSLLVSPHHSEDETSLPEMRPNFNVSSATFPDICISASKNDISDLTNPEFQQKEEPRADSGIIELLPIEADAAPEQERMTISDFQSAESAFMVFEDYRVSQDEPSPIITERRRPLPRTAQHMELTPVEPRTGSTPPSDDDNMMDYMKTFTMDDIVREMNLIAAKIGKDGLKIPSGTVIKLRHSNNDDEVAALGDDESVTGWTFAEPSDMSAFTYTGPTTMRKPASRCAVDSESTESPGKPPIRGATVVEKNPPVGFKKTRQAREDITERYCGGMYHLAILTGMPEYMEQEV